MEGIFIDDNAHFFMVSPTDEPDHYSVLTPHNKAIKIRVGTNRKMVHMGNEQGMYNGEDTLVWHNGEKWKRIKMTGMQWHYLSRRPYVPMTYIAYMVLKQFTIRMMTALPLLGAWKVMS